MNAEPWSASNGEQPGRGYSAVDLENAARRDVVGALEQRMPGKIAEIAAAMRAKEEAELALVRLRAEILNAFPGDAQAHAFNAARILNGAPDKNSKR